MRQTRTAQMLLLMGVTLCACTAPQQEEVAAAIPAAAPNARLSFDYGQPDGMTRAEYADHLTVEASKLAESELARLSAIELLYRNKLYYHSFYIPGTFSKGGVYVKMYRQFTDYSIVDITHPISILHPISITIEFDYDIIATDPVLTNEEDIKAARTAQNKTNPVFFRSDSVRRHYSCDELGVPASPLPGPLTRPNYWDTGTTQFEVFSLRAIPELRRSAQPKARNAKPRRR